MSARHRWAGLVLLGVLGSLTTALWSVSGLWAGAGPVPARTAQLPASPEPPLAPPGPPPAPRTAPAPATPPVAPPPIQAAPPPAAPPRDEGSPCPEDPPAPAVSLRIRVAATASAGQELEYRICIQNHSPAPAHHVLVRNPLPEHARFVRATPEPTTRAPELTWQLGTLEGCACREIVLVLQPTGTGDVKNCARVQFEHGQCVCTQICRPALSLRKCGPTQGVLYDSLSYQLEVRNTGSTPVTGVMLTDTLPAGLEHSSGRESLTWEVGALAPGESRCVDYQVVAKSVGRLCNRAVATAAGGLREEAESCVTIAEAKMTLAKTGPAQRYLNLPATYQITVTNTGTAPLQNVTIVDPLPAQTSFVSATHGGQQVGTEVRWTLGVLEAGASRTVEVVLRAQSAGRICNRATATAERGLTVQAEACTDFVGVSALLLEVIDTDDPVEVNTDSSYVILVRNQGTIPATNVRIEATAPEQLAIVRVTGAADHRKEGQRVLFNPLTIQARAEVRYVIFVKALRPGDIRFKVDLHADQLGSGPVHEEESTTVYADIPARLQPPEGNRQSRSRGAR